ncbi:MAG: DUF2905 domain-containing protein [Bacteroidia bacterium]|nr:DUF2905 domain-containing protein [Bacteroidia bacterium]MDW8088995.1 DUF2905 domain-containing protein [Bacteroidia bacterium]
MGKFLLTTGLLLAGIGLFVWLWETKGFALPRLPGDIVIERNNFRIYLPLGTSLIVSLLLSGLFYLLRRTS